MSFLWLYGTPKHYLLSVPFDAYDHVFPLELGVHLCTDLQGTLHTFCLIHCYFLIFHLLICSWIICEMTRINRPRPYLGFLFFTCQSALQVSKRRRFLL